MIGSAGALPDAERLCRAYFSMGDLAGRWGCSRGSVYNWIRGESVVDLAAGRRRKNWCHEKRFCASSGNTRRFFDETFYRQTREGMATAGSYAGKRIRISLGTANEAFATDIKRNVENAIIRGNDFSQYWPELRRILPSQSFRTLAATAEYTEPVVPATPTWLELRAAFALHMNYRVAISKLAASTRQRGTNTPCSRSRNF